MMIEDCNLFNLRQNALRDLLYVWAGGEPVRRLPLHCRTQSRHTAVCKVASYLGLLEKSGRIKGEGAGCGPRDTSLASGMTATITSERLVLTATLESSLAG